MSRSALRSMLGLAVGMALSAAPIIVDAVRLPKHLERRPTLESATGQALRPLRQVRWGKPSARTAAPWAAFRAAHGEGWRVIFDRATGVPLRIFGQGIEYPGSSADPARAERAAFDLLARHIDLLAPGARTSDFTLAANHFDPVTNVRAVGLWQHAGGLAVRGAHVSIEIKHDRVIILGSTAIPDARGANATGVGAELAGTLATAWILHDMGQTAQVRSVSAPFVLPLVSDAGVLGTPTVIEVVVDATAPLGRWSVYVDATSGVLVAREQLLRFATGTILADVPDRWPGKGRKVVPLVGSRVGAGSDVVSDLAGKITFNGASVAALVRVTGPVIHIINQAGAAFTATQTLADGGTITVGAPMQETSDAQLSAFTAARRSKEYVRKLNPNLGWLDEQQQVTVNINDQCNAFSDGDSINFFRSSGQCSNTAQLEDVVYHENGHSVHGQSVIPGVGDWDGALSEGVSDYLSATITNDPAMGIGFFKSAAPLRHADDVDRVWPQDQGGVHDTGVIIAGAQWDTRKNLIAELGTTAGVAHADKLWYACLQRASDIPSCYPAALGADDDDGNLDNGTPHKCAIDEAFARHGLAEPGVDTGPGVRAPTLTGLHLSVPVVGGMSEACPGKDISGAVLTWKVRGNEAMTGTVNLADTGAALEGDLPAVGDGLVLNYQVKVDFADGSSQLFPDNPADPFYELFLGEVTEIYCSDFEGSSPTAGWTHALDEGTAGEGADDWTWGTPAGATGSGDPSAALSGTHVWGNDLGGGNFNGKYQADKTNHLASPEIDVDVTGHTGVRLQYRRWLNVEDGDFDQARILADGQPVWSNRATGNMGEVHHTDKEWRFHDVDVSAAAADGKLQITFELNSDGGLEMGGWTIDDFCLVAYVAATCGDGKVSGGEQCDDGNTDDGDGCSATCTSEGGGGDGGDDGDGGGGGGAGDDGIGDPPGGCGCKVGGRSTPLSPLTALPLILLAGTALFARRRRRG